MPFNRLHRREFITLLGSAAVAWPFAARAQQHKGPVRLGFFPFGLPANAYERSRVEAFQHGLHRVGLIENRDVVLDVVWQGDDPDQAVTEGLRRGAELLIPCGSGASVAAQRRAPMIPIVFIQVGDPVAMGLAMRPVLATSWATSALNWWTSLELPNPQGTVGYLWYTGWPDGENRY
jgi:putative ABC transport system substrate-binding protein